MGQNSMPQDSRQLDATLKTGIGEATTPLETAKWMLEYGAKPVFIPLKKKGPETKNWHQSDYTTESAEQIFGGPCNIGILLGNEHNIVDVDLDCPESAAVARYLLPQETTVFGRESSPRSHYLYSCENAGDALRLKDGIGKVTVELRSQPGGKACQTVMPGSVHPSGEPIVWWGKKLPKEIGYGELSGLVYDIHAAAMLLRGYPAEGSRHDFWLYERRFSGQSCVGWSALAEFVGPENLNTLGFSETESAETAPTATTPGGNDIVDVEYLVHPCQFMKEEAGSLGVRVTRRGEAGRLVEETVICVRHKDGTRAILPAQTDRIETGVGTLDLLLPMTEAEGTKQWGYQDALAWESYSEPPVDIPTLMVEIFDLLDYYIDLPDEYKEGACVTMAYWCLMSYCFTAWHAVPYISLTGERGCGKSRVLDCLSELVFSPVIASNMSEPAMFRTMNATCGTLLYDEAEAVADKDRVELLTMLNAGHQSKFAIARRCEKKARGGFSVVDYRIFGPKAFAAIKTLPPALLSRSIIIPMVRASSRSPRIKRRVHTSADSFANIRSRLHTVALENHSLWHRLSMAPMPKGLEFSGRQIDLWQPIFALAREYTPERLGIIAEFAGISQSIEEERLENPAHKALLETLYDMRLEGKVPSGGEILDHLKVYGPSGIFDRWTSATIGRTLSNFGVRSVRVRDGDKRKRAYNIDTTDVSEVAMRHGYTIGRQTK